jgi:gluconokinase
MAQWIKDGKNAIVACSALKASYRELLFHGLDVKLVYLRGNYQNIADRVSHRQGHYAHAGLVASQFEALEEPMDALIVEVNHTPAEIVKLIRQNLGLL